MHYNFKRLIEKYSRTYEVLIPSTSYYDDYGKWVKGEPTKETVTGAILSIKESKIYRSEGNLTFEDKVLYTLYPLNFALTGAEILFEDKTYSILETSENSEFTGVYTYTLKYVSAFNKKG